MAEVEGSDGNYYNIPDFALEDTQEKMLAILKQQFKLSDQEVKAAQKALRSEEKNSKAQLDAFKKLGGDLQKAMDGRGTLLGSMGKGLKTTTGALTTLGGGLFKLGTVVAGVTAGLSALALSVTKGFGEDLRASGLVETGAAFGDLGNNLSTLVPQIQAMGMSLDTTLGIIQDFRQTMTVVGQDATKNLITEFNRLTASGSLYARTLSENVEYLADEIDFRQRLMFMDQRDSELVAKQTQEVLDSQIQSAMLLGKSVKEIADNAKAQILNNRSLTQVLASMEKGGVALNEVTKSINTFSGIGMSEDLQAALVQTIADPFFLASDEAKNLYNQIRLVNNQESAILQTELKNMQQAMQSRDPEKIAEANVKFRDAVVNFAGSIKDVENQAQLQTLADSQGFTYLQDFLSNQRLAAAGMERFVNGVLTAVSNEARLSALFDTQIEALEASFGSIRTAIRTGFAPALEQVTSLLGEASDPTSPLAKFNARIGKISTRLTEDLQRILGLNTSKSFLKEKEKAEADLITASNKVTNLKKEEGESQEEFNARKKKAKKEQEQAEEAAKTAREKYKEAVKNDQKFADDALTLVGDLLNELAVSLTNFVSDVKNGEGTLLERLGNAIMDHILVPLGNVLLDGLMAFFGSLPDLMDIITGNTSFQKAGEARRQISRLEDEDLTPEDLASKRSKIAEDLVDFSVEQKYSVKETAKLLADATMNFQDLDPKQLARVITSTKEMQNLIDAGLAGDEANQKDLVNTLIEGYGQRLDERGTLQSNASGMVRGSYGIEDRTDTAENLNKNIQYKSPESVAQPSTTLPNIAIVNASDIDDFPEVNKNPTSQDGSDTQSIKPAVPNKDAGSQSDGSDYIKLMYESTLRQEEDTRQMKRALGNVVKNTGATAANTG